MFLRQSTILAESGQPNMLLETRDLEKSYNGRKVVDRVSYRVEDGEIVGLLGNNGAGKTTSFRMTVGMMRPRAGACPAP